MKPFRGQTLTGEVSTDLPEFDDPPGDPLGLAQQWLETADERGVREPRALALATAGADGRVSSRVVLIKRLDADGLVFTSHYRSRKGRDADANPFASGTLYWRETLQQLTLAGRVARLGDEEADELFAARPRAARAAAAVSSQSQPLDDEEALRAAVVRLADSDEDIPRPADWGGYRLVPDEIEFWCGSPDRLHRRLRYERTAAGWQPSRLQP